MTAIYGPPSTLGKWGFQPSLDCIGKTEDGLKGNLLFLLGDSALQLTEKYFSHPSSYIRSSTSLRVASDSGLLSFDKNRIPSWVLTQKLEGNVGAVKAGPEAPKARLEALRPGWRPLKLGWKPGLKHTKLGWMLPRSGWMPPKEALRTCQKLQGLALKTWPPWPGINALKPGSCSQKPSSRPVEPHLRLAQGLTGEMDRRTYVYTDIRVHKFPCCIQHHPPWGRCSKSKRPWQPWQRKWDKDC